MNRTNKVNLKSDLNYLSSQKMFDAKKKVNKMQNKTNQSKEDLNTKKLSSLSKLNQNEKLNKKQPSNTQLADKTNQSYFKRARSFVKRCDSKLNVNSAKSDCQPDHHSKPKHQSKTNHSSSSLNRKIEKRNTQRNLSNLKNVNSAKSNDKLNDKSHDNSKSSKFPLKSLLGGIDPNRKSIENLFFKLYKSGDQLSDREIENVIKKNSTVECSSDTHPFRLSELDTESSNHAYLKSLINNKTNLTKSEVNLLNLNASNDLDRIENGNTYL